MESIPVGLFPLEGRAVLPRRAVGAGFDWTKTQNQEQYSILANDKTQMSAQLGRDRRVPFPSVLAFLLHWAPNAKKYRLYCYFHRHEKPAGGRYDDIVYSLTVWDRENNQMSWHDPWHQGHAARRADIQTFWANAAPNWLQNIPIVPVNYTALAAVQQAHRKMKPKFSQLSCVALSVGLMGHLEEAAPLRPPDRADVLEGKMGSQFADLAAATLQTLHESKEMMFWSCELVGRAATPRAYIRDNCRMNQDPQNARFRRQLRLALRKRFTENRSLLSYGPWIPDNMGC